MAEAVRRAKEKLASKNPTGRQAPKFEEVQDELKLIEEAALGKPLPDLEADGYPDPVIWTHLLSFKNVSSRVKYVIETYNADPEFPMDQHCYDQRKLGENQNFYVQDFSELRFSAVETDLCRYVMEAADRRQRMLDNP